MIRFIGTAANQAPLLIQVTSGAGSTSVCFGIEVAGQSSTGTASRPVLWRPSTLGTGTAQLPESRGEGSFGATSSATLLTAFGTSPSLPVVSTGAFNLPMKISWLVDPSDGVVFALGGAVALYQNAAGGHQINGSVTWEDM